MRPQYPFDAPEFGEMVEIAENIYWLRMPLPMALNHLNIYIFFDDDGITLVDSGLKYPKAMEIWENILQKLPQNQPIKRLLITHYHPDHIGLAAWLAEKTGAQILTSRMSYLLARMLQLDVQDRPSAHHKRYWQEAGYDETWIENRMNSRPFNFLDTTSALPLGVQTLTEGDSITLAGRNWRVHFGQGHAPDHLVLISQDFVLAGDQCLPAITPVISVFPTEPDANPLKEFMQSCEKLIPQTHDQQLFLCGHNRPFLGGQSRLQTLAHHHEDAIAKLRIALKTPKTMRDCYDFLFRRKIDASVEGFAISEATAHFNFLKNLGEIEGFWDKDGIYRWVKTA